jgi:hypothetical protein
LWSFLGIHLSFWIIIFTLVDFMDISKWRWVNLYNEDKNQAQNNDYFKCCNLNLGLVTKARGCKVAGQEKNPRVTSHAPGSAKECEGMNLHTPKWTPCWELESQWTPKSSKCNCKGQNPLPWKILYIIGNILKLRCLKWAHIAHLDIWNTSYGQKKNRESNRQFDSRPLKVGNRPNFLACR